MNPRDPSRRSNSPPRTPPSVPDHELVRHIGSGSFGEVWLARNLMRTWRAVKIVRRSNFTNNEDYSRERTGVAKFEPLSRKHEGLVDVLQVGELSDPVCFYYVMEIADDVLTGAGFGDCETYAPCTLEQVVARGERLPFDRCVELGVALAAALQFLHSHGLVHRDVKPSSVIIVDGIAKLADIGLVTGSDGAKTFVGTEGYIPPEGPGSAQADLYALGKLLYELAFGLDRKRFPDLPPGLAAEPEGSRLLELNDLLVRACAPQSGGRYLKAGEFLSDLLLLQSGQSVRRIRRLERRVRWTAWTLATAVMLLGVGFLGQHAWSLMVERRELVKRQGLMQQVTLTMLGDHTSGWREKVLRIIPSAGIGDTDLRDLAVANLRGMDAWQVLLWTNSPAEAVALDSRGGRLMAGGSTLVSQVVSISTKRPVTNGPTGALAVAFDRDDQPVELRLRGDGNLGIHREGRGLPTVSLDWGSGRPAASNVWTGFTALSEDGTTAVGLHGGRLVVWNTTSGNVRYAKETDGTAVAVSSDGSWLAVAHDRGDIELRELGGTREIVLPGSGRSRIQCLAFGRDFVRRGTSRENDWLLAAGDAGGRVTLWDVARRNVRNILRGSRYDILTLAFNPDSTLLASAGRDDIRLWDVAIGQQLLLLHAGDHFASVCFSPDGRRLAAANRKIHGDGMVQVWELEPDRGIQLLRGLGGQVTKLAVSPDDQLLAAVSHDWQVGVWELGSGRLRFVREVPAGVLADNSALAFSPDGHQLAFEAGQNVRLLDTQTGAEIRATNLPPGMVNALKYDPSGRLLSFRQEDEMVAGTTKRVGRVRDLLAAEPWVPLFETREFDKRLLDAVFAPDGRTLAVVGKDTNDHVAAIAYDTLTGIQKWRIPSVTSARSAALTIDSSGGVIRVDFASGTNATYRIGDGVMRPDIRMSDAAMARGGRLVAGHGQPDGRSEFGWSLFEDGHWILTLGIDQIPVGFPCFNHAGTVFVWANHDGTLSAANLDLIRKELARPAR